MIPHLHSFLCHHTSQTGLSIIPGPSFHNRITEFAEINALSVVPQVFPQVFPSLSEYYYQFQNLQLQKKNSNLN